MSIESVYAEFGFLFDLYFFRFFFFFQYEEHIDIDLGGYLKTL